MALRLLLVSVTGTLADANNQLNTQMGNEFARLAHDLHERGVRVALWSNRRWNIDGVSLSEHFSKLAGVPLEAHGWAQDGAPSRRLAHAVDPVLAKYGVAKHETILLGGDPEDMLAGVNSGLLHIRPDWYGQHTDYGFSVASVADLARFCFVFALRDHPIFFRLNQGNLNCQAAGPFSTLRPDYEIFGADARAAAKFGQGHPDFWFYLTVATLYFSGTLDGVNYICVYPGHCGDDAPDPNDSIESTLMRMGKCFRINLYHDLIVRHTPASKSQPIPAAQRNFRNQLQTIHLNALPHRNLSAKPNRTRINLQDKTVLVVDDFCTSGRSLEAARAYIEAAGGHARLFTWLKTINTPYVELANRPQLRPYAANEIPTEPPGRQHAYAWGIVDQNAPSELSRVFDLYKKWSW